MKNIIFIILIAFTCRAQTPIIPLFKSGATNIEGAYYKDVDNFYNQFIGTWVFNDGTNYLKVIFKKKTMFHVSDSFDNNFVDYLVGEYEYKVNNITLVNTIANIDINHTAIFNYNLWSIGIVGKSLFPECTSCANNEKRAVMDFQELTTRENSWAANAEFVMRYTIENGVEKINVNFLMKDPAGNIPSNLETDDAYQGFSLPFGDYTLTKV